MEEVGFKAQLVSEEGRARLDITHEQDWGHVLQGGRAR